MDFESKTLASKTLDEMPQWKHTMELIESFDEFACLAKEMFYDRHYLDQRLFVLDKIADNLSLRKPHLNNKIKQLVRYISHIVNEGSSPRYDCWVCGKGNAFGTDLFFDIVHLLSDFIELV